VRRIYCVFEKKRRAVHDCCHQLRQGIPFLPAGPRQGGGDGTSSSSGGTTTGGPCGTSSSETVTAEPCNETTTGGGRWDLLFLQQDFFHRWDHDSGALWVWDCLFLQWDRNNFGLRQRDLLFNNAHALCIGDLLFIVHNIRHQLEWRDRFIVEAMA
jgi:hypothetical protein